LCRIVVLTIDHFLLIIASRSVRLVLNIGGHCCKRRVIVIHIHHLVSMVDRVQLIRGLDSLGRVEIVLISPPVLFRNNFARLRHS